MIAILLAVVAEITPVGDTAALRAVLVEAKPGDTIALAPGMYKGAISAVNLQGTPEEPIRITAADPANPPVIDGGGSAIHLTDAAYVEISHLVIRSATGNGINIDDGGSFDTPSHHVLLKSITVQDIGPRGNCDGIKLSGVDHVRVEKCVIERWGSGGSGIDMVGCHDGVIDGCTLRHGDDVGASGVQAKGGSRRITIQRCRFEHAGQRAVNLGGSTGLEFVRIPGVSVSDPAGAELYEAADVIVEDCTFSGSLAPIAFVGVDGALVRHNTIYRPAKWCIRILQETRQPGFVPCRNGQFTDNLVLFRSGEMTTPVNVGDGVLAETFTFARNAWWCENDPARSTPKLPVRETDGRYGEDPRLVDAASGDFRLRDDSPLRGVHTPGVRPETPASSSGGGIP